MSAALLRAMCRRRDGVLWWGAWAGRCRRGAHHLRHPATPTCDGIPPLVLMQDHHHHEHEHEHEHGHGHEHEHKDDDCAQCAAGDPDHSHHHGHSHKHDSRVSSVGIECEGEAPARKGNGGG